MRTFLMLILILLGLGLVSTPELLACAGCDNAKSAFILPEKYKKAKVEAEETRDPSGEEAATEEVSEQLEQENTRRTKTRRKSTIRIIDDIYQK